MLKLFCNCDLLLKRDALRVVSKGNFIQLLHERSRLMKRWVLLGQLHIEDGRVLIKLERKEAASLHQCLLSRIELTYEGMEASQRLISQHIKIVTLGLVTQKHAAILQRVCLFTE